MLEQTSEHAEALSCAQQVLALDPWNEAALRRCMRMLAISRPDQALDLYDEFRNRLQQELKLLPRTATETLAQGLRRQAAPAPAVAQGTQRRRVVALLCEWEVHADAGNTDDAEALSAQLANRLDRARADLQDQGAWVQRAESGELLAFFGHPRALEQAPRLALDAALGLLAPVEDGKAMLVPRLGLHVGWGRSLPDQASPDSVGALTREARRLAWLARPSTARVSVELRQQSLHHHRFLATEADGSAELLDALSASAQLRQMQPMVGRGAELAALLAHWADAQHHSRAIWVQGEPGLGKTRLLQALRREIAASSGATTRRLQLFCQPEFGHSPWHPVVAALQRSLGPLADRHRAQAALQQLLLQAGLDPRASQEALSQLLLSQATDGPLNKRALQTLLIDLFEGLARGRPQLVTMEDLHWADPSTLELLALYLQRAASERSPSLIVMSSREPPPPALAGALQQVLNLQALPEAEMLHLIEQLELAPDSALERQQVLLRAQGVPLFAQELARSLRLTPQERVPATLWDLLAARLDRLPATARRLAQCAAVLGSDCDEALLLAMQDESSRPLQLSAGLGQLAGEGLLQACASGHWQFRHALIRDAAYESLGSSERCSLHRRAADALMGMFATRAADEPELLAHHLQAAGDPVAAHYWLQAGCRAAGQSAHVEARHLLQQGLQALTTLSAPPDLVQRLKLPLLLQLGNSLLALEGYGSGVARHCFEQALAVCPAESVAGPRFQALWGLWLGSRSGPGEVPALQLAEQLCVEAARTGDQAAAVQAAYALGNNLFFLGRLEAADQALEAAAKAGDRLAPELLTARYGEHGGIAARAMRCWPLALQGHAEAAQFHATLALTQARVLGHAQTLAFVLTMAAVMHRHLRQPGPALPLCQELLALADKHGLALWQAVGALVLGWVQAEGGDPGGLLPIRQAVAASAVAMPSTEPTFLSFLIEALLRLGQHEEALARSDEAMAKARERQELYLLPELWRMRAEAQARLCHPAAASDALAHAHQQACSMGASLWQQRCEQQATNPPDQPPPHPGRGLSTLHQR
ncbi:ATP-binding protein [Roseateles cavernae]|uniref:ATP-binding protein n=1 Tax=Roseateles cavernae TaxID=3153578 RepID=UPI0032E524DC